MDIIIHHALVMSVCFNLWYYSFSEKDVVDTTSKVMIVEVSNIFLLVKKIISDTKMKVPKPVHHMINGLFMSSFIYYRIYYYYVYFLKNDILQGRILHYCKRDVDVIILNAPIYGFYALNFYWAGLIVSKIFTSVKRNKEDK